MDTTAPFFSFFLLFTLSQTGLCAANTCRPSYCTFGSQIRFPFRLNSDPARCGYPGFNLSCTRGRTVLYLPFSGEFTVEFIDYGSQTISINDPDNCLPRRILNLNLSGTPFRAAASHSYNFYSCTSLPSDAVDYFPLFCRGDGNYTMIVTDAGQHVPQMNTSTCRKISTASVPVQFWTWLNGSTVYVYEDLLLTWKEPNCEACEAAGRSCGYRGDSMDINCSDSKTGSPGLPRSAKYGVIVGIGIPGLMFLIGLACCTFSRIKAINQRRQPDPELPHLEIGPLSTVIVTGLDEPTIESFPMTVLGDSRRLPKPNDGTCPICLSEYQPKDTLRTIPECNHYFHANCVDEWLKRNGTCPLCRNSPDLSSVATSSPATSSPSILLSPLSLSLPSTPDHPS